MSEFQDNIKPGFGIIHPNKYKKEDKYPDYKGDYRDHDGKLLSIAMWSKKNKNGKEFFTVKTEEPRVKEDGVPF